MKSAGGLHSADTGGSPIPPGDVITAGAGPVVSGGGFVTYFEGTSRYLPPGRYLVSFSVRNLHTLAGSVAGVQVLIDANPVPTATADSPASTTNASRTDVSGEGTVISAGGTFSYLVQIQLASGSGNLTPQSGCLEFRRVF